MLAAYRFQVSHYQTRLEGLQSPIKIAHLSDLHIGFWIQAGSVERWVEATLAEQPDAVVITGDLTDSARKHQVLPNLEPFRKLRVPLGIWGVWGNHDYRFSGYRFRDATQTQTWAQAKFHSPPPAPMYPPTELEQYLKQLGVQMLTNQGKLIRPDLFLAGVDDFWHGLPDLDQALAGQPRNTASLLLCHNPDFLYKVPKQVGLTLCGHTHGGQIVLPGYGPLTTSSAYKNKFAGGWVDHPVRAFISRGLGVSTAPIRFGCDAEIVVHQLVP